MKANNNESSQCNKERKETCGKIVEDIMKMDDDFFMYASSHLKSARHLLYKWIKQIVKKLQKKKWKDLPLKVFACNNLICKKKDFGRDDNKNSYRYENGSWKHLISLLNWNTCIKVVKWKKYFKTGIHP